jgi:hypothetical protein
VGPISDFAQLDVNTSDLQYDIGDRGDGNCIYALVNLGSFVDLGESYGILVRKLQGCTPYL